MATTTVEENERLAREHFDRVWHQGEFDADVLADDYRVHTNLGEHETHTLEEYRAFVERAREAIPDLRKEPDDVFATDEKVTIRYTMTGTQEGEFGGIPATGQTVEINAIVIQRVEDGKIAEEWVVADFLRVLKQLGVVDWPPIVLLSGSGGATARLLEVSKKRVSSLPLFETGEHR